MYRDFKQVAKKNNTRFFCGKEYNIIGDNEQKQNKNDITESEYEALHNNTSVYEINKSNYLNDMYVNIKTKKHEYNTYRACILYNEIALGKDVSRFTASEVRDLVESIPTSSAGQQYRVFKFINQYCKWVKDEQREIHMNPCDLLNAKEFTVNIDMLKKKIIGLDMFWEMCNTMISIGVHPQLVLPLAIARMGIYGKKGYDMLHLKYSDINVKEKTVTLWHENGELKTVVPITDEFIELVESTRHEQVVDSKYRAKYIDYGYVLQRSTFASSSSSIVETMAGIVKRVNIAYAKYEEYLESIGEKLIVAVKFNDLVKSRKFDLLFRIRSERKINTDDIMTVLRLYEPSISDGAWHSIAKDYKSVTEDEVLFKHCTGEKLVDPNSKQFVENLINELEYEGYNT